MSCTFVLFYMEFPEFGMVCPVSGCAGSTFFRKFDHLKKHWLQFHQWLVTLHKCSVWDTVFGAKEIGWKHIRSHHGQRGYLTSFTKVDCRFMSPGDVTLPLPRKKSTVPANLTPREQAAGQFDSKGAGCSSATEVSSGFRKFSNGGPKPAGSENHDQGYGDNLEARWIHGTKQRKTVGSSVYPRT